jgi:ankyrin repeat protein
MACGPFTRNIEVVKYLIQDCGANVEAIDNHGRTPLHGAVGNYDGIIQRRFTGDIIWYLVQEHHADVNAVDEFGDSPLYFVCRNCDLSTIYFIVEHGCLNLIDRISRMNHM